jgi:tetratricopeptide (TPR) repeat protein
MRYKTSPKLNSFSFSWVAAAVIITAGLWLAILIPNLQAWQWEQTDKLIKSASTISPASTSLLRQAAIIGFNDPIAIETLASSYWRAGQYQEAINTYDAAPITTNDIYLGNLSLKASDPSLARNFYNRASRSEESSESLSGLAIVEFIAGNISEGCNYASRAKKLNLSSPAANRANEVCLIESGTSNQATRQQAYTEASALMLSKSLSLLESISPKSVDDWTLIARIQASQGSLTKAISSVSRGLDQQPSNITALNLIIGLLKTSGQVGEAKTYQIQLDDTSFDKFK